MMHCPDCHKNYEHGDRHLWKCEGAADDSGCIICPSRELQELRVQISAHIKEHGSIDLVEGAFGDDSQNIGYVEKYIHTDKGISIKFYGCSFLYKGTANRELLDSVSTVKRTLMATVGLFSKYWFLILPSIPVLLLFLKTSIKAFCFWFAQIYEVDLKKKTYKYLSEFSPTPRELIRVGLLMANKIPLEDANEKDFKENYSKEFEGIDSQEFRIRVRRVVWCLGSFIQVDSAYYWRVQDPLSLLNKFCLLENPRKEILRLFDIAILRENQIKSKLVMIKNLFSLLLLVPSIKKIASEYLNMLNYKEITPDRDDFYFASRRQGYDFGGISHKDRKEIWSKVDRELGHIIIQA